MKRTGYSLLFLICAGAAQAQDTIVKRSDARLVVKVTEITPAEVKYRRLDMPDGPLFVERKEEIRMIIYKNGQTEIFELPKEAVAMGNDSIFMKNNEYVAGKVEKLTREEVRFHKAGFKNGPVYSMPMANVERIRFANDSVFHPLKDLVRMDSIPVTVAAPVVMQKPKELLITKEGRHYFYNKNQLTEKELHLQLLSSKNPVITQLVNDAKKVKKKEVVFMICTFAGPTLLVVWPVFVAAEPGFVITWLMIRKYRQDRNKEAVALYNAN
jgi:hypothetical protein